MKYIYICGIIAGSAVSMLSIADPTFYIKNSSDRFIYYNVYTKDLWDQPIPVSLEMMKLAPNGEKELDLLISDLSHIAIEYCSARQDCNNKNTTSHRATFEDLEKDDVKKVYIKFKIDKKGKPSVEPQEGRLNKTTKKGVLFGGYSLTGNIKKENIKNE